MFIFYYGCFLLWPAHKRLYLNHLRIHSARVILEFKFTLFFLRWIEWVPKLESNPSESKMSVLFFMLFQSLYAYICSESSMVCVTWFVCLVWTTWWNSGHIPNSVLRKHSWLSSQDYIWCREQTWVGLMAGIHCLYLLCLLWNLLDELRLKLHRLDLSLIGIFHCHKYKKHHICPMKT